MAALDPARLIGGASVLVGVTEEGADNHGQVVEMLLGEVGLPAGQPWCAAFVSHVGYWSHYDYAERSSSWPLPRTASCAVLRSGSASLYSWRA